MKYVYPSMIIFSMIVNVIIVLILSKKFKYNNDELISMIIVDTIGIIIGGLLYTKIVSKGLGFSSLGGVLGSLILLFIYSLVIKKDYKYILVLFMPSIPIMYAIGKIGCFVAGCCYGIPYDGIGNIVYHNSLVAPHNVGLFPIQIVESIVFILIFIYIISKYVNNQFSIKLVMYEIMICGITKLLLDFFRHDHISKLFTTNQVMCLVLIVISFMYLIKIRKKVRE